VIGDPPFCCGALNVILMVVVDITFAIMDVGCKGTTAAMKLEASESKL